MSCRVVLPLCLSEAVAPSRPSAKDRRPEARRHRRHVRRIQAVPAGSQTPLGNLPFNAVLHADGRHLLVTNNGQGMQSLQLPVQDANRLPSCSCRPSPCQPWM